MRVLFIFILFITACNTHDSLYIKEVNEFRNFKNGQFKNDEQSPILDKNNFLGLNYFEVDVSYKVKGTFVPVDFPQYIVLHADKKVSTTYENIGSISFSLSGKQFTLNAFIGPGENLSRIFIPFKDLTTGKSTYGAGRFLYAVKLEGTNGYTVDFNYAHNPYCAYNEQYRCPLAPKENFLNIEIQAGEKM